MKAPRARMLILLVSALVLASCPLAAQQFPVPDQGPRFVFLFIGDGMGKAHVEASIIDQAERGAPEGSVFEVFPVEGETATNNALGGTTDSAAAATALATGSKTLNGKINVNPLGKILQPTISRLSASAGRRVGVVSSVPLNHATPSAFYAFSDSRSDYYDIALQMLTSGFDYFGGGGILDPRGEGGTKPDIRDEAAKKGYRVLESRTELQALGSGDGRVIAFADPLDSDLSIPFLVDRSAGGQSLSDFVAAGIRILDNPQGFFLMVEGGKVDWASHDNDGPRMLGEMRDFDAAIRTALAFLKERPGETLVVVTADHETGGLSIADAGASILGRLSWSKTGHSSARVPVFAQGAGEDLFAGSYDNTGLFLRLKALLEASLPGNP